VTHPIASKAQKNTIASSLSLGSTRKGAVFSERLKNVTEQSLQQFCSCRKGPALPFERLKSHHNQNFSELSRCLKSLPVLLGWVVTMLLMPLVLQGMQAGCNFL